MRISDIRSGMSNVSVDAQILSISEVREVKLRDGTTARVVDCVIADSSGKIKLTLWNEQINMVREGSKISITNGYTREFKGESILNIGKYGKLTLLEY
jgi:replication factor A1